VVQAICTNQKIVSEDAISTVLDITGDVLMGFAHPDDVANELAKAIKLEPAVATAIQEALKAKIFTPLKQILETIYQPATAAQIKSSIVPNPNAPRMFDVANPASTAQASPAVPLPPKPNLSSKGWSELRPASLPSVQSAPRSAPAPLNTPQPPRPPQPPAAAVPPPVILGGTTFTGTPQKNADFHLSKTGGGAQVEFGQARPQAKATPAFIEFSKPAAQIQNPSPSRPSMPVAPAFKATPVANSGPRNVTEITANAPKPAVPKPPTPPSPPQPPKPPSPPMAQSSAQALAQPSTQQQPQPKIITKNFP
jgi:hypothetical protein